MSDEKSLVPIDQRTVTFYGDELTAVLVDVANEERVFVPVRPVCDFLGVDWSAQRQRINRDPVLADEMMSVVVTTTDIDPESRRPHSSEMLALPLDFINGWLFGINANRVKEDVRERLIRYQRECYQVLARAFLDVPAGGETPAIRALMQVREVGRAIMQMAEEQIVFERRLDTTESQVEETAVVVSELTERVTALEERAGAAEAVSQDQAMQISQAVKAVALKLGEQTGRNEYGGVYGELYRRFEITSYKLLPASRFEEAMDWFNEWYQRLTDDVAF